MYYSEIIKNFNAALADVGIITKESIIADSQLHRFHIEGQRLGTKNGAYVLHADCAPAGWAMDYRSGTVVHWHADSKPLRLSQENRKQRETVRFQRQQVQEQLHHQAALKARHIWNRAIVAEIDNAYCNRKNIKPFEAKTGHSGSLETF